MNKSQFKNLIQECIRGILSEKAEDDPCWKDYEMVGMKTKNGKKVPNCVPVKEINLTNEQAISFLESLKETCGVCGRNCDCGDDCDCPPLYEDEKQDKPLNKPFRTPSGPKKFSVYVKNSKGNVVKVNFGDPNMDIKRDSDERRKSFRARHNCSDKTDKTKAGYWSCKMWQKGKSVDDMLKKEIKECVREVLSEGKYDSKYKKLSREATKLINQASKDLKSIDIDEEVPNSIMSNFNDLQNLLEDLKGVLRDINDEHFKEKLKNESVNELKFKQPIGQTQARDYTPAQQKRFIQWMRKEPRSHVEKLHNQIKREIPKARSNPERLANLEMWDRLFSTAEKNLKEATIKNGDDVRVKKGAPVVDKKYIGKMGMVTGKSGQELDVKFPDGRTIILKSKNVEKVELNESVEYLIRNDASRTEEKELIKLVKDFGGKVVDVSDKGGIVEIPNNRSDSFDRELSKIKSSGRLQNNKKINIRGLIDKLD
jgi:hypothetical protein